jgi:hypothetical protein
MRNICRLIFVVLFTFACRTTCAWAEDAQNSARNRARFVSGLTYGAEERIRSENWSNVVDFNSKVADERHQVRFRTRLWMGISLGKHIDLFAGLNNEFKKQTTPDLKLDSDEIVFESCYLDIKNIFIPGLSLRIGRQNLFKGDGILIFEGDPQDGSRTTYFNAADLSYSYKKSSLELIGILDPKRDQFLPRINDKSKPLIEWKEQAVGFYYTDKNHPRTQFENYYFYKKETLDSRSTLNRQFQPDRHLHTAGTRIMHTFDKGLSLTGEFATQWGRQQPGNDIRGLGGYGYLKKSFDRGWKPYLQAGAWAFSGDDPATPGIEGWDPLFARWPKWSELYLYSLSREKGVAYWTDIWMTQAEAGFSPHRLLDVRLTYFHLQAFHPFPGDPNVFGRGKNRGEMLQGRMDLKINKNVKGHVLYENLLPGSFYASKDAAYFLRFEVVFSFSGKRLASVVK